MANINQFRHVQNSPSVNVDSYTFTMPDNVVEGCGVTSVVIGLDDVQNEMEVEINFVFDNLKQNFIDNCSVVVGDIVFASNFVDIGAGQPIGSAVSLGTEDNTQLDYANFIATQTIEVRWL